MIVDPGIKIDKGYPAYDRGLAQDVFLKVQLPAVVWVFFMNMFQVGEDIFVVVFLVCRTTMATILSA